MKTFIRSIFWTYLFILWGCQAETINYTNDNESLLEVRVSANALTLPEVERNTRTAGVADENTVYESDILVFDENDLYLTRQNVVEGKVKIPYGNKKRTIYIIANARTILDQVSVNWTERQTSLNEVLESLYEERKPECMPEVPFKMYGKLVFQNGIDKNSAITDNGTHTGGPLLLKRNVAKISVSIGTELSKTFTIKGIMLCKAPKSGYLISNVCRDPAIYDNYTLSAGNNTLYSFMATQETTIIIEADVINNNGHETRYFKIAVKESESQGAAGLKQNNWYKITLINKTGIGFASLEDAINGHVFDHIDIMLEVKDITMHDFVFGTDFFIATSNSNYEQYGYRIGEHFYEICKIRFANSLDNDEVLGSTSIETLSEDIELSPQTIHDIANARNHVTYSVYANFKKPTTSGWIRVRFKNVDKNISIKVEPQKDLREDQFLEIPYSVIGSIADKTLTWCGINDEKAFTQNKFLDINSPEGRVLYLTIQNNPNLYEPRDAEALFTRTKTGLTRIRIHQNPDNNILYLADNGVLSVGNASKATTDKMLFFKFGSVIGFNNPVTGVNWDNKYIKYNPSNQEVGTHITVFDQNFDLPGIPCYNDSDLSGKLSVTSPNYHNASNIRKGKGDPCVLVGLTSLQIKTMSDDALNAYQSGYRMPTNEEQLSFSGLPANDNNYTKHWWNEFPDNQVAGAEFPERRGYLGYFLPAAGYITPQGERLHKGSYGYYWTNHVAETIPGWGESPFCLEFNNGHVNPANGQGYFSEGMPIRCVRSR